MYLSADKVGEAFRKLKAVAENKDLSCIKNARFPVSVEDVVNVVSEATGFKIEKYLVDFEGKHVRGQIEKYHKERRAKIYVRKDQDEANRRFVTVKEAMHLVIDEDADCNPYGDETIGSIVTDAYGLPPEENPGPAKDHLQSEQIAEWAAIEIMYPYEVRLPDEQLIKEGKTSYNALALKYELPAEIVAKALHPQYMKICSVIWAKVQKLR